MAIVFRLGGITFDDPSKLVVLILPSDAKSDVPITFHDVAGANYQVPSNFSLVIGKVVALGEDINVIYKIGGADGVDGAITVEAVMFSVAQSLRPEIIEVLGVIPADKYVTGSSDSASSAEEVRAGTTCYGVLVAD